MEQRVLLCTTAGELPTWGFNESLTDAQSQRFTRGQDIFTSTGHVHCHALHILAQNISWPAKILEYPTWKDFEKEVAKGYAFIGISFFHVHLGIVTRMCEAIRRLAPESKIILGSYGVMAFCEAYDKEEQERLADHVCHGEGVRFLQRLLGDPDDKPITQRLLPKCGFAVPWLDPYPEGNSGMLISGLGCPSGCDFCTTTHHYGKKRYELLSPEQCFEEMKRRRRLNKRVGHTVIIEEDHFLQKDHLKALGELIRQDTEFGLEELGFYTFGSIAAIDNLWDEEEIALTGVNSVFIGVESKFAAEGGYNKRAGDASAVFKKLRKIGVGQTGAWMCGWDWHTRANITEDLDWFVALEPTLNQLARVCPFQGTALYDRMKEEGRLDDVPFEDVHFYGGGLRHTNFEPHELMMLIDRGYRQLYETWGSTQVRQFKLHLNGYEFCRAAKAPELRKQRAGYHQRLAQNMWPLLEANKRFAPNGYVRQSIVKLDRRFRGLFGEPTRQQRFVSKYILYRAHMGKLHDMIWPANMYPRTEAPKVYDYANDSELGPLEYPYTVSHPHFSFPYEANRVTQAVRRAMLGTALAVLGGPKARNPADRRVKDTLGYNPLDNRAGAADEVAPEAVAELASAVKGL